MKSPNKLANLFLHYAFDKWMERNYPQNPFERYADDIIAHCNSESEATNLKEAIKQRLLECKLKLHPEKTRIVYFKG
jgi:RNA-directed DNA polymerase